MNTRPGVKRLVILCAGLLGSCDSQRTDPPPAQDSSPKDATSLVKVQSGQAFAASCLIVDTGDTVEWRNLTPATAVTVVSTAVPYELSSPALQTAYNYVPLESSDECVLQSKTGCLAAVPFSFWRHTFTVPGTFDYHDTSGGSVTALASSSQSEYGTPPGSQQSSTAATGTVCVRLASDPTNCDKVCCSGTNTADCATGVTCINGRCGGVQ